MSLIRSAALLASLGDFFAGSCTIQESTMASRSEYGTPQLTWSDLSGHVDVPCRMAPVNSIRTAESRLADMTVRATTRVVLLAGHYPSINEAMRAVIDGVTYGIVDVRADGESLATELVVERVSV